MLALKTDDELLVGLGQKIKRMRLDNNWTQAELSARSSIPCSTLRRLENTGDGSLRDFVQALRALGGLDEQLAELVRPPPVSPYELLRLQGKKRTRASRSAATSTATTKDTPPQAIDAPDRPIPNGLEPLKRPGTYW